MIDLVLFILFAVILYLMRKFIQKRIQGLVMLLGGKPHQGIYLYSILFLPGVMIHELSHFFVAAFLGVRTGEIAIFPRSEGVMEKRVVLGSVKVAKTDFIRGSLIGAAPFVVGCIVIYVLVKIFILPEIIQLNQLSTGVLVNILLSMSLDRMKLIWLVLLFIVANTMFSSKEDAKTFPVLLFFLGLVAILAFKLNMTAQFGSVWNRFIETVRALQVSFLVTIMLNLVVTGILLLIEKLMEKLTRKRILYR